MLIDRAVRRDQLKRLAVGGTPGIDPLGSGDSLGCPRGFFVRSTQELGLARKAAQQVGGGRVCFLSDHDVAEQRTSPDQPVRSLRLDHVDSRTDRGSRF